MKHSVIGIDLGTTYSAVAAWDDDELVTEIIGDSAEGDAVTTPSVVSFDRVGERVLVGWAAKRNLPNAPEDTIIEVKREMGELRDPESGGGPSERVPLDLEFADRRCLPQEISALVLMKMKAIAEAAIGAEVHDAVITVPAWFTENQRGATKQAARLAGLYPRELIAEPTAAAICYTGDRPDDTLRTYVVFDLGGGTFDVSIITAEGSKREVIATAGDRRLGGGDFDNSITDWAVEELRTQHSIDVSEDDRARSLIKFRAEEAKIRLSGHLSTELVLAELRPSQPPVLTLTRETMSALIAEDLGKSKNVLVTALNLAAAKGVAREQIDAVLLVGGSTRMPAVRAMLLDYFDKDESFFRGDLDPATVVARGAALVAHTYQPTAHAFDVLGEAEEGLANPDAELSVEAVTRICEHSLGFEVQDNRCHRMMDLGTALPTQATEGGFTNSGRTDRIDARIFQGEGSVVFENTYIGMVVVDGLEPLPAHSYQFEMTFKLDRSGLLEVIVMETRLQRRWDARFEHGASVRTELLRETHERLCDMFASGGPRVAPEPEIGAPEGYEGPPPPSAAGEPTAGAAPAAEPDAGAGAALVDVELDAVPAEFKTYLRRARRQLAQEPDAALAAAYNAFATAVVGGAPEDDVVELGDALTEALDATRHSRS